VLTKNKIPVTGLREIADKALNSTLKVKGTLWLKPGKSAGVPVNYPVSRETEPQSGQTETAGAIRA
jgi:hypothetical protein